jgi:hypothetical protein
MMRLYLWYISGPDDLKKDLDRMFFYVSGIGELIGLMMTMMMMIMMMMS